MLLLVAVAVMAAIVVTTIVLPRRDAAAPAPVPDHGSANALGARAGFDVAVSDVHLPGAAGRVTLSVSFHNSSTHQQRADPLDFAFRDGSGAAVGPVFDASCPHWTRTDLHPAGGAGGSPRDSEARQAGVDFGPVPLCFDLAHAPAAGSVLVWSPDVGFLATPVAIELR
jgi:hypothetical protein